MQSAALLAVLVAITLVFGSISTASAAQLDATINTNNETSPFQIKYQRTVSIPYKDGGDVADYLRGTEWHLTANAPAGSDDSFTIGDMINRNIQSDGSQVLVSDLDIDYSASLRGRTIGTSIDYQIVITGNINNYIIRAPDGSNPALIEMGWRALSIDGPVTIGETEINQPFSAIKTEDLELASLIEGSEAETLLHKNLINADFIRDQPLDNWHFLFDPTGINADAERFGLSDEILGHVVSTFTMGESSIREGIQIDRQFEATFDADKTYTVRTFQSADIANVAVIGYAQLDSLDGIEIFGVLPTAPPGGGNSGGFSVSIMYGMAGMAVIGGVGFFIFSSRQLKKDGNQGQTGIDPSRLVGSSTSESAGGYQTNRGEAQLLDDTSYQQTRNVYADSNPQVNPPQNTMPQVTQEAACGCAASSEMQSECDCQMQGSCLCDADCQCNASLCKEHAGSF